MSFLPENYESPKSSNNYMKLQEGENRIRILSQPIIGWEDWQDKKPIRYEFDKKPTKQIDPKKPIKHFWSFIVFNHAEEQVQILHITQNTIRSSIEALCKDSDWGAPYHYDIKIHKSGEGMETKYAVNPVPHKPLDPYIQKCFKEKPCNLNAVLSNEDPFAANQKSYTKLGIELTAKTDIESKKDLVSKEDIEKLKSLFDECDPDYQKDLLHTLSIMKTPVNRIEDVPSSIFNRILEAVVRKRDEYKKNPPFLKAI